MDLGAMLQSRRWVRRERPFPHVRATDVFQPAVYFEMEAAFQEILSRGFAAGEDGERFARGIEGYDVYAFSLQRSMPSALHVFLSRQWHDVLAGVTGVRTTGDVNGALHHHLPGSKSGLPHNDLNPGWFQGEAAPGEVNVSDLRRCSYHTGQGFGEGAGVPARETVRAVACLFYLNNAPWRPGDGGETGLYLDSKSRTEAPASAVPPINNSLLVFECTPRSFHAFIRNPSWPRNSLVMWLHRDKDEVLRRWGQQAIVGWEGPRILNAL